MFELCLLYGATYGLIANDDYVRTVFGRAI